MKLISAFLILQANYSQMKAQASENSEVIYYYSVLNIKSMLNLKISYYYITIRYRNNIVPNCNMFEWARNCAKPKSDIYLSYA